MPIERGFLAVIRSACGEIVDTCFDAPWYDDHWYFLLASTPLPDLFPARFAHPWPTGGLKTLERIADLGTADQHFTFVHSLASHPPTVIDADCEPVSSFDDSLGSQLRCTHATLLDALATIDLTTDIVIITADHGYEVGSLSAAPETWSDTTARDRFSAFTAISPPDGCEDGFPVELSGAQIIPLVLNCYGGELSAPEHRFMKVSHQARGGLAATELSWDGWSPYTP